MFNERCVEVKVVAFISVLAIGLYLLTIATRGDDVSYVVNKETFYRLLSTDSEIEQVQESLSQIDMKSEESAPESFKIGSKTQEIDIESVEHCEPVNDIIFIKTHKTASSTVQNILFRYGKRHDLTFGLPANNGNRFNYPSLFRANMVKKIESPINIITNHLRASDELKTVIPNGRKITIIRSIPSLYESSFGYFNSQVGAFKRAGSLEAFALDPGKYFSPNANNGWEQFAKNHIGGCLRFINKEVGTNLMFD